MKKLLLLLLLSVTATALCGQDIRKSGRPKSDDGYWDRKNLIGLGVSAFSSNGYGLGFAPVTLSYDRKLKYNITLGGLLHVANHCFTFATDSYEVYDTDVLVLARVGYDLRVARKVYLRFGIGAGLGYHSINDLESGCMRGPCAPLPATPASIVKPQLLVDIHWVFRVGRNVEMMFAPLLVSPSQLIFSPWKDKYYTQGFYNLNFIPVRICVRF